MNPNAAAVLRKQTEEAEEDPPLRWTGPYPPIYRPDAQKTSSRLGSPLLGNFGAATARFKVLRWDMQTELKAHPLRTVETAPTNPLARVDTPRELPNPLAWSSNLVRVVFDVLGGRRELASLRRWIDPQLYGRVAARVNEERATAKTAPVQVRSARLCRLSTEIVEVAIVVEDQGRVRAAALRLEAFRGRWRVTALELG